MIEAESKENVAQIYTWNFCAAAKLDVEKEKASLRTRQYFVTAVDEISNQQKDRWRRRIWES